MDKVYHPQKTEDTIYQRWKASGFFNPDKLPGAQKRKPFTISMPPPNVTGTLHIGHAMFLTIQDIMTRYHRMKGDAALWLPGTDHASIATQNKVEKMLLEKEGKTRHDFVREEFLKRVEQYVEESQDIIKTQIRKMGSSCDWSRERYTLDAGLTRAVQEVFVRMYRDGLIYQQNRVVNWCVRCASTLADDEVEYKPKKTKLYTFRYEKDFPIEISTTRPETKFGDTIVAVHPSDKRYKKYIGKEYKVNFLGVLLKILVIADESIDKIFGTGAVGVTPAHSKQDEALAQKHHKIKYINVMSIDGTMLKQAGAFFGMPVKEARNKIIEALTKKGLVSKIKEIEHELSVCYRCGSAIEPINLMQWFINVNKELRIKSETLKSIMGKENATLKEISLAVVKKGEIEILPHRFKKIYYHWMENLHDWCISRQLWFGHRIPAWRCKQRKVTKEIPCEQPIVSIEPPLKCAGCNGAEFEQDPDTLDTWFSSGLWTFSTLGWPKKTNDLKRFHPTSVMETGYDILFFWVARMILMTTYNLGEVPFRTVYLHGLVRDKLGRKMSKSLGNGIDPLEMIRKYGADATRLSLVIGTTPGNDVRLYEEKIAGYRNFVNKVWNISRFVLMQTKNEKETFDYEKIKDELTDADKYILGGLFKLVQSVNVNLEQFKFPQAGEAVYDFIWRLFADWYIEVVKIEKKAHQKALLRFILEKCLIMLHPFVPFVTEEIWGQLGRKDLIIAPWPQTQSFSKMCDPTAASGFGHVQEAVNEIRKYRNENNISYREKFEVFSVITGAEPQPALNLLKRNKDVIEGMTKAKLSVSTKLSVDEMDEKGYVVIPTLIGKLYIEKKQKIVSQKNQEDLKKYISDLEKRLANKEFLKNAPQEVVEKERARLAEALARIGG